MEAENLYGPIIAMVGKKFRQIRESRNIQQPEIATSIGKTASALSQIEKGKIRGVSLLTVFQLIDALDIDPSAFFAEIALWLRWAKKKHELKQDPRLARTLPILDQMFRKITGFEGTFPPSEGESDVSTPF